MRGWVDSHSQTLLMYWTYIPEYLGIGYFTMPPVSFGEILTVMTSNRPAHSLMTLLEVNSHFDVYYFIYHLFRAVNKRLKLPVIYFLQCYGV